MELQQQKDLLDGLDYLDHPTYLCLVAVEPRLCNSVELSVPKSLASTRRPALERLQVAKRSEDQFT